MMLQDSIITHLSRWVDGKPDAPVQVSINPTYACNLQCGSCWQRGREGRLVDKISRDRLFGLIREAKTLGVRCIELTGGGEPLCRLDDIIALVREIKTSGMIGWMTTNGTLFNESAVDAMVRYGWDKVTISIDGPDASTNDRLRPPQGSFDKIIRSLSLFKHFKQQYGNDKPELTFNVVISRYNYSQAASMIELAAQWGVGRVTFETVKMLTPACKDLEIDFGRNAAGIQSVMREAQAIARTSGVSTNAGDLLHAPELIEYSGNFTAQKQVNNLGSAPKPFSTSPCFEPWFHFCVEADGTARPCCASPGFGDTVVERSLSDIWHGKAFNDIRSRLAQGVLPEYCKQCNVNVLLFSRDIAARLREGSASCSVDRGLMPDNPYKMLVTDTAPLYPPLWGGPRRIWQLYSAFSARSFDIMYAGVRTDMHKTERFRWQRISEHFCEIDVAIPSHYIFWSPFRRLLFDRTSIDLFLYFWMHTDWQFRHIVAMHNADIVVCSHPWSSPSLKKRPGQVFIYDAHNCEYLLMKQIMRRHPLKWLVLARVKTIEADACRKSDLILVCSDKEKQDFMRLYGVVESRIEVVPNGTVVRDNPVSLAERIAARERLHIAEKDQVIIFIGAYYKPNIDATDFILTKLAPDMPECRFLVVGTVMEAFKSRRVPGNVRFLGRVSESDLDSALASADVAINPMFDGSGVNIKMLDYMAYGLPIVTTECGARGIPVGEMPPFIYASPEDFIGKLRQLLQDGKLRQTISEEARRLVKLHYNWADISARLQHRILSMCRKLKVTGVI